jgi:hypothetical protein
MWEQIINYQAYFYGAFSLLIPLLSYAVYLQLKTFRGLKNQQKEEFNKSQNREEERQKNLQESIRIISMATIQEQCETSEACLRIANLLPHYKSINHREASLRPLFNMFEEIKVLKTLQERKELKLAQRHAEDQVRYAIEDKYHEDILKICEFLYEKTKEMEDKV